MFFADVYFVCMFVLLVASSLARFLIDPRAFISLLTFVFLSLHRRSLARIFVAACRCLTFPIIIALNYSDLPCFFVLCFFARNFCAVLNALAACVFILNSI